MDLDTTIRGKAADRAQGTAYAILVTMGVCHLLNDMIQSVIPALYPLLKDKFEFTFAQIGVITLVFQLTSSIFQPFVGLYADRHPQPYSLAAGMCFTLCGLVALAFSPNFGLILLSVALIGCGSSVFHPEASRVAQMASGGRKSLAQSIFQVGGNGGSAVGPLLAALIVMPYGQHAVGWFALAALLASALLARVGNWYRRMLAEAKAMHRKMQAATCTLPERTVRKAFGILVLMIFSKYFFNACMTSYFTFFLMEKFGISAQASQFCLFAYLAAFAIGLGAAPFTLAMPYLNLFGTIAMSVITGVVIASAFSAIVVYATDLKPDKVGMVAGIFFGLMFGLGGIGSAFFGWLADLTSIEFIFRVSTWLPLLGIVAFALPDVRPGKNQVLRSK